MVWVLGCLDQSMNGRRSARHEHRRPLDPRSDATPALLFSCFHPLPLLSHLLETLYTRFCLLGCSCCCDICV